HQLLADATGGRVGLRKTPEVGGLTVNRTDRGRVARWRQVLPDPITVLQWHGAEVTDIPANGEVLAKSDVCEVQAFRVGRHAYGLQCHCGVEAAALETLA